MSPENEHATPWIRLIESAIQAGEVEKALERLLEYGENIIDTGKASTVLHFIELVKALAPQARRETPRLWLLAGQAHLALGDLTDAALSLETARAEFARLQQPSYEVQCLLLLARLYHRYEDLSTARFHLDRAAHLMHESVLDQKTQAEIYLRLAQLAPDTGQLRQAKHLAERALTLFERLNEPRGQFEALRLLALVAQQKGEFRIALARLEVARQRIKAGHLGARTRVEVLNTEAHVQWYQGNLDRALSIVEKATAMADRNYLAKFRVYHRLVRANILRALGRYPEAHIAYEEAYECAQEEGFHLFLHWVDVNAAWLDVLENNFGLAKTKIYRALETADKGQAISFNTFLGAIHALMGRHQEAERIFSASLTYYSESDDRLSQLALRFLLTYVHLGLDQTERAEEYLEQALSWACANNIDYFPHWWHPALMARVCAHALTVNLYQDLVERIFVKRLKGAGSKELLGLLQHVPPKVQALVMDILENMNEDSFLDTLAFRKIEPRIRAIIKELLRDGPLNPRALPRLVEKLTPPGRRRKSSLVIVATFGLYIQGRSRRAIAARLGRAEPTIRNHITIIYECFGLHHQDIRSRQDRRQRLRELALKEGFIRER